MTDILDYVQPVGYNSLFVCGFAFDDAENEGTKKYAAFMKVTSNGRVEQFYRWGQGLDNQPDNCRSIAFDYNKREIILLLEVTSENLRPDYSSYSTYSSLNSDTLLVRLQDNGEIIKGYNINFDTASVSMKLGESSMFVLNNHYVFAG